MHEKFYSVDGLRIKLIECGSGPTVLLLHGGTLGLTSGSWRNSIEPLAAVGYRVVAYDQPGFGQSEAPADFSLGFRVRFVRSILDAIGAPRSFVVGHSQGGAIAVQCALEFPDRFYGVAALGTGSLLPSVGEAGGEVLPPKEPSPIDTRGMLLSNMFRADLVTDALVDATHIVSIGLNYSNALRRAEAAAATATDMGSLWNRLDEIPVPGLFVYGADDKPNTAERVTMARRKYPSLRVCLLGECGHLIQYDRPDEVLHLLTTFFSHCLSKGSQ